MERMLSLALIVSLAACEPSAETARTEATSTESTPSATTTPPSGTEPGIALPTLLDQVFLRDDDGRLSVLKRLKEPNRVDMDTRQNRHVPGQIDTSRALVYDGLSITVYHVSGGKEIINYITVTDPTYETDDGLHVGITRSDLETVRGTPGSRHNGTYVYELDGEMPPHLEVDFDGETVRQLTWNYPID